MWYGFRPTSGSSQLACTPRMPNATGPREPRWDKAVSDTYRLGDLLALAR